MYKSFIFVSVLLVAFIEARPKWQILPEVPGYVPVYIRNGDTPLEEINPDLAEAFHALPIGRSVNKELDAAIDSEQPQIISEVLAVDDPKSNENTRQEKMKVTYDIVNPIERR